MESLDFIDQEAVAYQFSDTVCAQRRCHARSVDGGPLGTAVLHGSSAVGIPLVNVQGLADIQIDIGVGVRGQLSAPLATLEVPACDTPSAHHGRCEDLHGRALSQMGSDGRRRQTQGHHQKIESTRQ